MNEVLTIYLDHALRAQKNLETFSQDHRARHSQGSNLSLLTPGAVLLPHLYTVSYLINFFKIGPRKYLTDGMSLEQCLTFARSSVNIQWVGGRMNGRING